MTTQWATRRETGEALGISRQRVEQFIAKGVIVETEHGIDLAAAKQAYAARVDVMRRAQYETRKELEGAPVTAVPQQETASSAPASAPGEGGTVTVALDYNAQRARRERINADLQEMKFKTESGRLISRDEVKAKEFEVARMLRDRILGWPARLVNHIPPEAMRILSDECDALIRDMQDAAARISEQTSH